MSWWQLEVEGQTYGRGKCGGGLQCWPAFEQPYKEPAGSDATRDYSYKVHVVKEMTVSFPQFEEPGCAVFFVRQFRFPVGLAGGCVKAGNCQGEANWTSYPSTGCITGLIFGGPCTRSSEFQSRCMDGLIDNGTELFGDITPQPSSAEPNGFLALAEYDKSGNGGNNNGRIESSDAIFTSLRLWQDINHNGVSEPAELRDFPASGLSGIDVTFKESKSTDEHGNRFRYRAKVYDSAGNPAGRWAWDVFLTVVQ